jgi:hypothetical protein
MDDIDQDSDLDKYIFTDNDPSELGDGSSINIVSGNAGSIANTFAKQALVRLNEKQAEVDQQRKRLNKLIDGILAAAGLDDKRASILRDALDAAKDDGRCTDDAQDFEGECDEALEQHLLPLAGRYFLSHMQDLQEADNKTDGFNKAASRLVCTSFEVRVPAAAPLPRHVAPLRADPLPR